MNETYTKLRDFALEHRDDSCENGNDNDVRYWVGYIDGLDALYTVCGQKTDWSEVDE